MEQGKSNPEQSHEIPAFLDLNFALSSPSSSDEAEEVAEQILKEESKASD